MILDSADDQIWDKKSIKALIELVWQEYRPVILKWQFCPYILDTYLCYILFTGTDMFSSIEWNQFECMKIVDDNGEIMKEGTCHESSLAYQIVLSVLCIAFVIINISIELT